MAQLAGKLLGIRQLHPTHLVQEVGVIVVGDEDSTVLRELHKEGFLTDTELEVELERLRKAGG
ncbi:MAG TPA: hypothetical protein VHQ99_04105 [Gaiellaceae bacterium]|jgi:hypothetical protein|nr:hypothetical protein [Gaiellaceae bacterium]